MNIPDRQLCYLTTTGRVTGQPHEIEIWFAPADDGRIYLLSGGRDRSDWVKNLRRDPNVSVRVGDERFAGTAQVIEGSDEDQAAREALAARYQQWSPGQELSNWAKTSLPVAIQLDRPDQTQAAG